jgi:hypothetical protein
MTILYILIGILVFLLLKKLYMRRKSCCPYREEYGSVIDVQPSQFTLPLGKLKAHYLDNRGRISVEDLDVVLNKIQPTESYGVMSISNDIENRKGCENSPEMLKQIVPYSNPILEKRGVKIGRNPFDNSVIITPYSGPDNSFPYPVGFWIRVVDKDSVY